MKKLNRKGFTLIELLAVIVILAIVLVVTIPSVIRAMDQARASQLQNSADSVAEWFQKNYDLDTLAEIDNGADESYKEFVCTKSGSGTNITYSDCKSLGTSGTGFNTTTLDIGNTKANAVLKAAGIGGGVSDVKGSVTMNGDKVCVSLSAQNATGTNSRFKGVTGNKCSSGCSSCPQS